MVKAHPLNCAQFVDCGVTNYIDLDVIKECEYPQLFSPITLRCEDFEKVQCGPRHEPKAPCKYIVNLQQLHKDQIMYAFYIYPHSTIIVKPSKFSCTIAANVHCDAMCIHF